jgi:site-specific DNA-methyltransferase (cytosine-N4-specific)
MVLAARVSEQARMALEQKYAHLMTERLEWGNYVNYGANKVEPIYGWFRFKEAFSRRLVQDIVQQEWQLPMGSLIFDPFAGCGTTLLASYQSGYNSAGCDIMPIAVFVTKVKLAYEQYDIRELECAVEHLLARVPPPSSSEWPNVKIINLAFSQKTRSDILAYRDEILRQPNQLVRDFLMLGLLASLEETSYTSKDGQFLRLVRRKPRSVRDALERNYARMLGDLQVVRLTESSNGKPYRSAEIIHGDARVLPEQLTRLRGRVRGIVTSPPYLNRYDYSRSYALELCLMYGEDGEPCVQEFEDLKNIRHSLLRSHIESRPAPTNLVDMPALEEILLNLSRKSLNNARIPIMIEGYFEDMNLVIAGMAKLLAPDGRVALVVANARFEGELVPVDLMLSELAYQHGLETEEIRITRYKGNSSQQMGKYGKVPVRESICFWRKRRAE